MGRYIVKANNPEEAMIGLKAYNDYSFTERGSLICVRTLESGRKSFDVKWEPRKTGVSIHVVERLPTL